MKIILIHTTISWEITLLYKLCHKLHFTVLTSHGITLTCCNCNR
uniref:Uncharacterized protein n=1 Tax=Anguilla anguilla TaxID=7936 RepID=A0A0E9P7B3_ANGAN